MVMGWSVVRGRPTGSRAPAIPARAMPRAYAHWKTPSLTIRSNPDGEVSKKPQASKTLIENPVLSRTVTKPSQNDAKSNDSIAANPADDPAESRPQVPSASAARLGLDSRSVRQAPGRDGGTLTAVP